MRPVLAAVLLSCSFVATATAQQAPFLDQRDLGGAGAALEPATDRARDAAERELCGDAPFLGGRVLVELAPGTELEIARLLLDTPRYRVERALFPRAGLFLVAIADGTRVPEAVRELGALPFVRTAAPDHVTKVRGGAPNDALFAQQWNLANTGQAGGVPGADIGALAAWERGTGDAAFAIAIVDGGVAINHPDLAPNRWLNVHEAFGTPGIDDDGNGYVDDRFGWDVVGGDGILPSDQHGSHVSGIAGARGDNGIGVCGVNWRTSLVHVAATGSTSNAVAGYAYVAKLREDWLASGGTHGANVVVANSSFGIDLGDCEAPAFRVWNTAFDALGELGIVSVVATTNADVDVDAVGDVPSTCTSAWLVTVASTDRRDQRAPAGHGALSVDLAAPGVAVRSCNATNGWIELSGTSMATPHVAGAVAWLHSVASDDFEDHFAADPAAGALALIDVLRDHVEVLPALVGLTATGGRLDLDAAGDAISSYIAPSQTGPLAIASVWPKALAAVRVDAPSSLVVAGNGFLAVQEVRLDGVLLSAFPPQYTVLSDGQIRVGIENGLALGTHTLEVATPSHTASTTFEIVPNTALVVDLVASQPSFVVQALGAHCHVGAPLDHVAYLVVSFSPAPSILPGFVSLDLGNNFFDVTILWSGAVDPATGSHLFSSGPLGQFLLGTKVYFQAASFSLSAPAFPLFASNRQTGTLLF